MLDFKSPTLVVGEVPMELVELVECHEVEELHHFFLGVEVTGHVEHQATPSETGCILNLYRRDAPALAHLGIRFNFTGEELTEGLDTGHYAPIGITGDGYAFRVGGQGIGVFHAFHLAYVQVDVAFSFVHLEAIAGGWFQDADEVFSSRAKLRVVDADGRAFGEYEIGGVLLQAHGNRQDGCVLDNGRGIVASCHHQGDA